jgi:hypothetical protein
MVRRLYLIPIVIVCLTAGVAYRVAPARMAPPKAELPVPLTASGLDFGEAWEQQRFSWTITVANPTDAPVTVDRFAADCGCVAADRTALTVPPRGQANVKFNIDLRDKPGVVSQPRRAFRVMISPVVSSAMTPVVWYLQGVVKKAVVADPPVLDFGESLVSGEPFAARSVRVAALAPIGGLQAEVEPASLGTATVQHQQNEYYVELSPSPHFPVGPIRAEIRLTPTAPGGDLLPAIVVPVIGLVVQSVAAEPPSILFGSPRSARRSSRPSCSVRETAACSPSGRSVRH